MQVRMDKLIFLCLSQAFIAFCVILGNIYLLTLGRQTEYETTIGLQARHLLYRESRSLLSVTG